MQEAGLAETKVSALIQYGIDGREETTCGRCSQTFHMCPRAAKFTNAEPSAASGSTSKCWRFVSCSTQTEVKATGPKSMLISSALSGAFGMVCCNMARLQEARFVEHRVEVAEPAGTGIQQQLRDMLGRLTF